MFDGWEAKFNRRVAAIEAGLYDVEDLYTADGRSLDYDGNTPDADDCSFL